ncbi:SDR family oxidoreductase [Nocardiopsis sp. L17-MgMaSL7]|uniref:SDR family oxidoreductase n=1 Tax=Nocardiopsis sp. L17-MgMaSL7 TaxID=1938893 RepID=UPI000D715B6E|nr:SDR family oxidoreductase [Nocardiopsis sp. L17-MgMaSL7]PWV52884.1 short-subunit dehydrogenase [Nocardiopsis sp. L17-MgMaSL7]
MSTRPHRHVTATDGQRLAVYSAGDPSGPTLVLVHGYPDNASVWDTLAADLAADHHVVTYDVRGAGRSTAPDDRTGYLLGQLADDLRAVVDSVSPGHPVHLVAHDWGSIQTWHAVTEPAHAHRFASFTSLSGPDLDHAGHWLREAPDGVRNVLRQAVRSSYIGFLSTPGLPEAAWLSGIGGLALAALERVGGGPRVPARRATRDYLNGLALYRANMLRRFTRPTGRRTGVPVQALAPTHDAFMVDQVQSNAGRWADDFRFHRFHGGHWSLRSRPAPVARRVRAFVAEIESGAPRPVRNLTAQQARRHGGAFAGQVAVITGAGGGIGRCLAFELAERGARIVAVDVNGPAAERTAALCSLVTPGSAARRVDVTDAAAMDGLASWVREEYGAPDMVVNNAGIGVAGPFLEATAEDLERVVDVNLWGVINGVRAFAPMMVESGGGGRIVNTASAASYLPSRLYGAYSATKAAVLALSRSLRGELAGRGVSVTAVCPGLIDTGIVSSARVSGLGEVSRTKDRLNRLYRLRGYTPERAARRIADAVESDPEMVPVTSEAHIGLALSRISPAAVRGYARVAPPL